MGGFIAEADVARHFSLSHPVLLDQCLSHLPVPTAAYKIIIQRLTIIIVWPMARVSSLLVLHRTHRVH